MPTLIILLVGQAMAVMDGSILVVASPSLRADLHASSAELQLVVAMYTLAFAALVVAGARLGDILGRRRAFVIGLGAFAGASCAGGLAPTPLLLILARALQGAAGALMTPQVLSIIQTQFSGEMRVRAISAYSAVLAVGVAAGQILGGLLVSAHLLRAAWRPALLLNVPIGICLLCASRRWLPGQEDAVPRRLDLTGAVLLAIVQLLLVLPLVLGRGLGWPAWVWPCLGACPLVAWAFVIRERSLGARAGHPLLELRMFSLPGVAAGLLGVLLLTGCYGGLLLSLTLYLQGALRFSALHAGLVFAIYASGFAVASLTWSRGQPALRERLPVAGPVIMGGAVLAIGCIARAGGWPLAALAPLLAAAGAGHACGFSPLASRLTSVAASTQAADLSGLILTASLIGQVVGIAVFTSVYLGTYPHAPAHALAVTAYALAGALLAGAGCAAWALRRGGTGGPADQASRNSASPASSRAASSASV
ncbi:MAG: MFS transporter [Solirubrobacteraceae bacterium]